MARHDLKYIEACRVTLVEFQHYNTAYAIMKEDKRHDAAIQAWFNQQVQAVKGTGKNAKSAYSKFKDFYDHEKEFNAIFEPVSQQTQRRSIADVNRLMNKKEKKGGN